VEGANAAVQRTVDHFKRLDILISNAGFMHKDAVGPIGIICLDAVQQTMDVNFRCPVAMTKMAMPYLEKTKGNQGCQMRHFYFANTQDNNLASLGTLMK
jgi:NAD(P)-dependent dehydrogenase (short-subunit alcohol dehydrogenase family)